MTLCCVSPLDFMRHFPGKIQNIKSKIRKSLVNSQALDYERNKSLPFSEDKNNSEKSCGAIAYFRKTCIKLTSGIFCFYCLKTFKQLSVSKFMFWRVFSIMPKAQDIVNSTERLPGNGN